MVQFYGVATVPQDVGYYTGIMVGTFPKTVFKWGRNWAEAAAHPAIVKVTEYRKRIT